jgi:hypothetical protein
MRKSRGKCVKFRKPTQYEEFEITRIGDGIHYVRKAGWILELPFKAQHHLL